MVSTPLNKQSIQYIYWQIIKHDPYRKLICSQVKLKRDQGNVSMSSELSLNTSHLQKWAHIFPFQWAISLTKIANSKAQQWGCYNYLHSNGLTIYSWLCFLVQEITQELLGAERIPCLPCQIISWVNCYLLTSSYKYWKGFKQECCTHFGLSQFKKDELNLKNMLSTGTMMAWRL